jgi:hypothetical protein
LNDNRVERAFDLPAGSGLIVRNSNGSILVRGGTGPGGLASAFRTPGPELPHTRFLSLDIDQGPSVVIRCSYSCSRVAASVDMEIILPPTVHSLLAETVNGNIILESPRCPVKAQTCNGFIRATGPSGSYVLSTRNGPVDSSSTGPLSSISTLNGNIRARVSALASDGAVITSTLGSIELLLPDSLSAELDAAAGRGALGLVGLRLDSPAAGSGYLRGRLGTGGSRLQVRTRLGSLTLSRLIPDNGAPTA